MQKQRRNQALNMQLGYQNASVEKQSRSEYVRGKGLEVQKAYQSSDYTCQREFTIKSLHAA